MGVLKLATPFYSVEEYFRIDKEAELRCEYHAGEIVAMAGSTTRHNEISGNIFADLHTKIRSKGKRCKTFISDVRLRSVDKNHYYYPDVLVVCDESDLENNKEVENPIIVVEVLSDSTQKADLTTKLSVYLQIPSLQYYLVVSQTEVMVLCYERNETQWVLHLYDDLTQQIALPALDISLSVEDIYKTI